MIRPATADHEGDNLKICFSPVFDSRPIGSAGVFLKGNSVHAPFRSRTFGWGV
jgi:hypothetical protein